MNVVGVIIEHPQYGFLLQLRGQDAQAEDLFERPFAFNIEQVLRKFLDQQ